MPTAAPDSVEDRIRAAFGLARGRLPEVNTQTLARYHAYLARQMWFPFAARYPEVVGLHDEVVHKVMVYGLIEPVRNLADDSAGLLTLARKGSRRVMLPLAELEVPVDEPNYQFIEDYWYWFWNWR